MATPAPSCKQALNDATSRFPDRDKSSDGIMGDAAHQKRKSDHNEGNAFDLGYDPDHGVNCDLLSRLVINSNDARVKYVIWNHQVFNRDRPEAGWHDYTGPNPHTHHMHVSIRETARDDLSPWPWSGTDPLPTKLPFPGKPVERGNNGTDVRLVQRQLREHGSDISADGGFGTHTFDAVTKFQTDQGLEANGVVDQKTWDALFGN